MLRQSLIDPRAFAIVFISNAFEISVAKAVKIIKNPTFKIGGSNVIMHITIPSPPTVDFIIFSPPIIEAIASDRALPTIGIKLPDRNFAVLIPIVSAFDAIVLCIVKIPTNMVANKESENITTFLTAVVNPFMLKLSFMLALIERAKKDPVTGSRKSAVIEDTICAIMKIVELYPTEVITPLDIAIIPAKIGI